MTEYELNEQDIKNVKFSPKVEMRYYRFDKGFVVKRIETSFVRDQFLEDVKSGKYDKKQDEPIKVE